MSDRCEFVIAASEQKAFSRVVKLELFINKYPSSELLSQARYEQALTLWLLGDVGGALDKFARNAEIINSYESEALLAFLLFSKALKQQAQLWLKRARHDSSDELISDLLDLYILKSDFEFTSPQRCASEVARLLRRGTVDEAIAINLAERAHALSNNQTASLRFHIALNGFDEIAKAGVDKLGIKEYEESPKMRLERKCLLVEIEGEHSEPIENALLVWLKERGIESKYFDDKGNIVIGPYAYEEIERMRMELEKFFDLRPEIGACPKKANNGGK